MASGRVKGPLRLRNSGSGLGLQEPVSPRALRFPGLISSWSSGRRMFWALPGTTPRAPLASLLVPQASSGAQKRSCPHHVHVTLGQPGKAPVRLCPPSPTLPAPPCDGLLDGPSSGPRVPAHAPIGPGQAQPSPKRSPSPYTCPHPVAPPLRPVVCGSTGTVIGTSRPRTPVLWAGLGASPAYCCCLTC